MRPLSNILKRLMSAFSGKPGPVRLREHVNGVFQSQAKILKPSDRGLTRRLFLALGLSGLPAKGLLGVFTDGGDELAGWREIHGESQDQLGRDRFDRHLARGELFQGYLDFKPVFVHHLMPPSHATDGFSWADLENLTWGGK